MTALSPRAEQQLGPLASQTNLEDGPSPAKRPRLVQTATKKLIGNGHRSTLVHPYVTRDSSVEVVAGPSAPPARLDKGKGKAREVLEQTICSPMETDSSPQTSSTDLGVGSSSRTTDGAKANAPPERSISPLVVEVIAADPPPAPPVPVRKPYDLAACRDRPPPRPPEHDIELYRFRRTETPSVRPYPLPERVTPARQLRPMSSGSRIGSQKPRLTSSIETSFVSGSPEKLRSPKRRPLQLAAAPSNATIDLSGRSRVSVEEGDEDDDPSIWQGLFADRWNHNLIDREVDPNADEDDPPPDPYETDEDEEPPANAKLPKALSMGAWSKPAYHGLEESVPYLTNLDAFVWSDGRRERSPPRNRWPRQWSDLAREKGKPASRHDRR